ncbi:MAG: VWA domain-containing protein [Planctomycetota bacterium]|nr:MAG: VWA domain-containing protein [Planctomycetota bacterium]
MWRCADPWWLLALIVPVLVLIWQPRPLSLTFGAYALAVRALRPSLGPLIYRLLMGLGIACVVLALARPQGGRIIVETQHSGRDMILLIDLSASMIADDMFDDAGQRVDRLETVFRAAEQFIQGRPSDRLGVAVFGSTALLVCPPTMDHYSLRRSLHDVERQMRDDWERTRHPQHGVPTGGVVGPGTNTGLGIAVSMGYLEEEAPEGKSIIILADGRDSRNLPNWVDPVEAAAQAARMGIRIHAIGVGDREGQMTDPRVQYHTGQQRLMDLPDLFLPEIERLQVIADQADGEVLYADTREQLYRIFDRIDELEPTHHIYQETRHYSDYFRYFLVVAASLIALASVLMLRLRGVP